LALPAGHHQDVKQRRDGFLLHSGCARCAMLAPMANGLVCRSLCTPRRRSPICFPSWTNIPLANSPQSAQHCSALCFSCSSYIGRQPLDRLNGGCRRAAAIGHLCGTYRMRPRYFRRSRAEKDTEQICGLRCRYGIYSVERDTKPWPYNPTTNCNLSFYPLVNEANSFNQAQLLCLTYSCVSNRP
jgi:hypothetical protein